MKISVVIPCYNEEQTVLQIVKMVQGVLVDNEYEIIIIDDFSTDNTKQVIDSIIANDNSVKAVYHDKNMGKGAALRSGFNACSGDVVIIQDADLEYDPSEYGKLLKPIQDGKADVVYGSRFKSGDAERVLYYWHSVGNLF